MSNHFPTVPALDLVSITYTAEFSGDDAAGYLQHLDGFDVTGVVPMSDVFGPQILGTGILTAPFNFTTPGDAGSFDQDTQESLIASVLDDVAQAVATASGQTLATIQGVITVQRQWAWQDSGSQYNLSHTDAMTYPV